MEGSAQRGDGETVRARWGCSWRWTAVLAAWALVAVVVAAMLAAAWVYESETPVDRCWRLPRSRTDKTVSGDFIGLPLSLPAERKAEYTALGYRLIYQYPDRPSTYVHDVLEGSGGGDTDFIDWVWWRLTTAIQHTTVPKAVVLFVHGHGGNGRQVKDLSVVLQSLRPSLTDDATHHSELAVFGTQFKGELSALQGNTLRRQAMYVNDCLNYLINDLYPPARPPKIVIIGHSMGGVVARAALMMPNSLSHAVTALITIGSPLQMSLWPLDPSLTTFYHELNSFRPAPNESVPTFSIAGGLRDHLIRTELSAFYGIDPSSSQEDSSFAFTTAIPGVSTTIDHDSLMTCGQFLTVLGRCILHIVNPKPVHQYASPREQALAAFRHHFLSPVPRLLGLKSGSLEVEKPQPNNAPTQNATIEQTEVINHHAQYFYEDDISNRTQEHSLSLSAWRQRYGQLQLLVATSLPPHMLTLTLSSNTTNSSIPSNWWIEAPISYVSRAFVGANSTLNATSPRILITPAEVLNAHDLLLLRVSPLTPDPLHVSNNITTNTTSPFFLFVQLYNEYVAQIPVFGDDGGMFTVPGSGRFGAASAEGVVANDVRPALTHFLLPGNAQAMSVWVSRVESSSSQHMTEPMWEPMIYQYSTCSAVLFEEENVYLDTSPALIRSHYRTIPQLYRECSNASESAVHLFLFTDPQYEYQVVIEEHPWVELGHVFSPFTTLALPAAFFIFSLVFAVQRWMFARHGSLHSFAWVLLRLVPVLLVAALCASAALYIFNPPWFLLHESALVFTDLSPFTFSFSFTHDPVTNQRMPAFVPLVVLTYGTLLVMIYAMTQVCLVPCMLAAHEKATRMRAAIARRPVCQRAVVQRASERLRHSSSTTFFKAVGGVLFIVLSLYEPFFMSIFAALALTLVWVEDEALRYFRHSLSVLLALFSTYHFGCLWLSLSATHPFDTAAAFTLPTLALALFTLYLTRMSQTPLLHYFLAIVAAGVAGYLFLFCWHAVHMIVYAVSALSVVALLTLAVSLLHTWYGQLRACLVRTPVPVDVEDIYGLDDTDTSSAPLVGSPISSLFVRSFC